MKSLFTVIAFVFLAGASVQAAPYLVFTGTAVGNVTSGTGAVASVVNYTMVTDLADTSKFAVLEEDPKSKVFTVVARPSASPPAEEPFTNFLGGIVVTGGKFGEATFGFTDNQTVESGLLTVVSESYATGPLTLATTTLVAARTKPLIVTTKTNGVVTGTVTFDPSAAITSAGRTFPKALKGSYVHYVFVTVAGNMIKTNAPGVLSLVENPADTTLANIGGGLTVGKSVFAVQPIAGPTTADYTTWLTTLATDQGYTQAGNLPAVVAQEELASSSGVSGSSISTGYSGATLSYSTGISISSGGTLQAAGNYGNGGVVAAGSTLSTGGASVNSSSTSNVLNATNLTFNGGGTLQFQLDNVLSGGNISNSTSLNLGGGTLISGSGGTGAFVLDFNNTGTYVGSSATNGNSVITLGGSISVNPELLSSQNATILNVNGLGLISSNTGTTTASTGTTSGSAGN